MVLRGRLVFWGYLGTMFAICLVAALFSFTARTVIEKQNNSQSAFIMDGLLRFGHEPERLRAEVARLARLRVADVSFYDPRGTFIASSLAPPLPMVEPAVLTALERVEFVPLGLHLSAQAVRENGRLVAIGIVRFGNDRTPWLIRSVAVILILLLALAILFGRFVARPLERIAAVARRFGQGDLSARSGLSRGDEIGDVSRSFDDMADRVTSLMSAQQELMANVSHELQTPLARIRVAVDLLIDGISHEAMEVLPGIGEDLGELERLIDDVMTVSRLELSRYDGPVAGVPLRLERVALGDIVDKAEARFRAQHASHRLVVEGTPDFTAIEADPILLRRVIDNLLENARKYSEPGSQVIVRVIGQADAISIEIVDHGIGMSEEDRKRAFTPFFRSDSSRTRATGGVGLGLALARRVVEAHRGKISIDSALGKGTTVRLILPVA